MTAPEPSPKEFDAYSRDYDTHVNTALAFSGLTVDYFTKVKAAYIRSILSNIFGTTDLDVLDVGCGVGNYHSLFRPNMRRLWGVDISSESLKIAGQRNEHVEYVHFDGVNLPFPDRSFDVVFSICVYHHVAVAQRALLTRSVKSALRPGGLFLIFEHNPRNPLTMRVVNRCEFDRDAVLLKSEESERLMWEAGFKQVVSKHILTLPSFGKMTRLFDRAFSGLRIGAQFYTSGRTPDASER